MTRKEVAKMANVSVATVSNVLNNTKHVGHEVRQRVLDAIEKLNYKPNYYAQTLNSRFSYQVGVIVENLTNPYYGEIVEGINELALDAGYSVGLYTAQNKITKNVEQLLERKMDGVFICLEMDENDLKILRRLRDEGISIVVGGMENDLYSSIQINYGEGIHKAVKHLHDLGHRKVAFISGLMAGVGEFREMVFRESVAALGMEVSEELIVGSVFPFETTIKAGTLAVRKLLERKVEFTAIVAINDLMAIGAMTELREQGISVPKDVSVIGFDDIVYAEFADPPLTTLRVPKREMGRYVMRMLLNQIQGGGIQSIMLDTELIVRRSTGARGR